MRERAEDERGISQRRILRRDELDGVAPETRACPPLVVRGGECELEIRMIENECAELTAGIATRPEHSDGCSIHSECIIMRAGSVNGPLSGRARRCYRMPVQSTSGGRKPERQEAILRLIASHAVASQEELRRLLEERGWRVTQATLSRDLRELGLVRAQTDDGARYVRPETLGLDEDKPSLEALLPQLFDDVDGVSELLVLHTLPSGAQPIAEAIDAQGWPEIIGTIAGENTILIVCRSSEARQELAQRLRTMAGRRAAVRQ